MSNLFKQDPWRETFRKLLAIKLQENLESSASMASFQSEPGPVSFHFERLIRLLKHQKFVPLLGMNFLHDLVWTTVKNRKRMDHLKWNLAGENRHWRRSKRSPTPVWYPACLLRVEPNKPPWIAMAKMAKTMENIFVATHAIQCRKMKNQSRWGRKIWTLGVKIWFRQVGFFFYRPYLP